MIRIQLLRNTELNSFLLDEGFLESWKNLASQTLGFHLLQEPDFILTWYKHYQSKYEPVFLLGIDPSEELVGLMALAWDKENQSLTHGGHFSAEYHGWLAKPANSNEFFVQSLLTIKKHFALKKWEWNFLPPHLPFDLSIPEKQELKEAGVFLINKHEKSPLWNLNDPAKLKKSLKSSSLRSKRNRLRKRGELRFEFFQDAEKAKETLEIAAKQYDFRKEAQHNSRPFEDDPNILSFNKDLIDQGNCLHCCALWLDDRLLAFHQGATDGKSLQLGLISFDPSEYASSPGAILFAELAKSLTEEGYDTFDITPGGDSYKQRYANSFVEIKKPTVYFSRTEFEKGQLKSRVKNYLQNKGLLEKTKALWLMLNKNSFRLSRNRPLFPLENVPKRQLFPINTRKHEPYTWQRLEIVQQNYEDLLLYQGNAPYKNRRQLLIDAYEKFKQSERLYTVKTNDALEAFGWKKVLKKATCIAGELLAPGTVVLYDFYVKSPELKELMFQAIKQAMLSDILPDQEVYLLKEREETSLVEFRVRRERPILKPA